MELEKLNLFGAYIAIFILSISSLIFIFRLLNYEIAAYWTGILFMLSIVPLLYMTFESSNEDRSILYYIQTSLMIIFIIIELLLDYILKYNFRQTNWMVISYVTFFFASTGGMIGIAAQAGKFWMIIAIILFLIMTSLAFIQRAKTGL